MSLLAFVRGCTALAKQPAWQAVCAEAAALPPESPGRDIAAFFESRFDPHLVVNADESTTGMVTGYYEPLLRGSRTRTARYRYPLYAVPQDLLVIDLSSVYPDLKHKRLRGRIEGNRVVPYLARGDIETDPAPLKGLEIGWVDDAVELFFLHIQGSGQVQLENGQRVRVGYADQNGHPTADGRRVNLPVEDGLDNVPFGDLVSSLLLGLDSLLGLITGSRRENGGKR